MSSRTSPIHAEAPEFTDMSVEQEILVTGIKVVDLLAPYAKGGKIGRCSPFSFFSMIVSSHKETIFNSSSLY